MGKISYRPQTGETPPGYITVWAQHLEVEPQPEYITITVQHVEVEPKVVTTKHGKR